MIRITRTFAIPEPEIDETFIQSSGPGGQNVNKVATAVQLRFNIEASALPESVKSRLRALAHNQISTDGILIVEARDHRSQHRNRKAAREKFADLVRKALKPPRKRKETRPTKAAEEKRLRKKKIHSKKKQQRKNPPFPD